MTVIELLNSLQFIPAAALISIIVAVISFLYFIHRILADNACLKKDVNHIDKQVSNHITETTGQIKDLNISINKRLEKIDQRFEKVDQRFEKMNEKFEKIDQRFEKMNEKFEKIDQRFNEQNKEIREISNSMNQQFKQVIGLIIQNKSHK